MTRTTTHHTHTLSASMLHVLLALSTLSTFIPATSAALAGQPNDLSRSHATRRRHHARLSPPASPSTHTPDSNASNHDANLAKRYDGAKLTYYIDGQGACGWTSKPQDYVVAIPAGMWANGAHCGKQITIWANGKSASAQVVDECPGCNGADLDLSEGLFSHFASTSEGVIYGNWDFSGNGDGKSGGGGKKKGGKHRRQESEGESEDVSGEDNDSECDLCVEDEPDQ